MALDKNLFTLNIEQSKVEANAVDLVDSTGTAYYRKCRGMNESYQFSLIDPLSDSMLASVVAPGASSKEKVIELHNPSATVTLSLKGTLTFKWVFNWEQHLFEWKREACYMVRKPDPPVLVAISKDPAGKVKTSSVQILDYNLNRFDIEDRKGLEIILLTSLLTLFDHYELQRAKASDTATTTTAPNVSTSAPATPPPPPKPEGWRDAVAILQAKEQHEINEVVVGEPGEVADYVKYCVSLLNDDTLLFITLRSQSPEFVSKVVQVAESTKRTRYKSGGWDEELHQYVSTEDDAKKKGKGPPRVINLNDTASSSKPYQPPASLTIHLSKIAMPELEPKARHLKGGRTSAHAKAVSEGAPRKPGKRQVSPQIVPSKPQSSPSSPRNERRQSSTSYPNMPPHIPPPYPHTATPSTRYPPPNTSDIGRSQLPPQQSIPPLPTGNNRYPAVPPLQQAGQSRPKSPPGSLGLFGKLW